MKTLIIDGNNTAYRAKYVYFLEHNNEDVSVVFGVLSILIAEMKQFKPDSIIVCFDAGIPPFRKELLPKYKSQRHKKTTKEDRENFLRQLNILYEVLPLFGIACVKVDNQEADDLMSTTSKMLFGEKVLYSSDADILQNIQPDNSVSVYNPTKKFHYKSDNFEEKMSVPLCKYLDYKIMIGDDSDNIEGIRGIGPKTAAALLEVYGSLNNAHKAASNGSWKLSDSIKSKLISVDSSYIEKVRRVIRLGYDHQLAKQIQATFVHKPYDYLEGKKFLITKGFVSMFSKIRVFETLQYPAWKDLNPFNMKVIVKR